ncbi:MAG: PAS domain S-box protein [Elusimicrobiota bacterium]|jgi:PAS domain S-box-containing protein
MKKKTPRARVRPLARRRADARPGIDAIINKSPMIMFELDPKGTFKSSLGGALEKLGLRPGQVKGRSALTMYADSPAVVEGLRRALRGDAFCQTVSVGDMYFEVCYTPRFDHNRRLASVIGLAVDVTERCRAEKALVDNEERHLILMEKTGQLIYDYDVHCGRIVWSGPIYKVTGYSPSEFADFDIKRWEESIHPDDREMVLRRMEESRRHNAPYECTYRFRLKSGAYMWVEDHGSFMGESGRAQRMLGTIDDISARRAAEEESRRERDFSAMLIESSPAFFTAIDRDGKLLLMNKVMLQALGYTLAEVTGADYLRKFVPENEHAGLSEIFRRISVLHKSTVNENHLLAKDGRRLLVEWHGSPVMMGKEFAYLIGVGIDITERKKVEEERARLLELEHHARAEAEASSRAKDEFLAIVSHELRTPITAIMGWNWLLRSGGLSADEQKRALDVIDRNMQLQRQIIEDLLDISTLTRKQLALDKSAVDLGRSARGACEALRILAEAKGISLRAEIDSGVGVSGDSSRLQQVFWNLLHNAIKFSPKNGSVALTLQREGDQAVVKVADSGPGIAAHFLAHLLQLFRQAEASLTREHGGLGLGLAIVKSIVELHGGRVAADNGGPLGGAVFSVFLPCVSLPKSAAGEPAAALGPLGKMMGVLTGVDVIIVDDEPDTLTMLEAVLQRCGARVRAVLNAAQALEQLDASVPHVLLCDIAMPGEDGYSLIRRVRARPLELGGDVPAAALTAYTRPEDRTRALLAGYQIYLPKPVDPAELVTVVSNLAGRQRMPR